MSLLCERSSWLRGALIGLSIAGCSGGEEVSGDAPPSDVAVDAEPPHVEISFWSATPGAEAERVEAIGYSDPFDVRVNGLPPGARVTLHARSFGNHSHADFVASSAGEIDVARDAALEGTYTGVDREGLVWSMQRETAGTPGMYDIECAVEIDGVTVGDAKLVRHGFGYGLRNRAVSDDGLVGQLWAPDDGAAHPTLLVVGGSEGGLDTAAFQAMYLASYGYTTLALAYFDAGALPRTLTEIPLEYFGTALSWLAQQPEVDAERIAAWGASRGGELVLMLGATFPQIRAVVAEAPSHVRWAEAAGTAPPTHSAWSYQGTPLPYVPVAPGARAVSETLPSGDVGYRFAPAASQSVAEASADTLAAATIAVEATKGPVLLLAGSDDGLWPTCEFAAAALARLQGLGHATQYADDAVCYEGSGHLFGPPGSPTLDLYAVREPGSSQWTVLGGTPAGTAHAQREAHTRTLAFLATALR